MKRTYFRIEIAKTGWLFIGLCLGIGIAALNTGNNLLYLVFGMMCSFLILSGILSNNTLSRLVIVPRFPGRIFAEEPTTVRVELVNRKRRFPSFSLTLFPDGAGTESEDRAFVLKIPPGGAAWASHRVRFPNRGRFPLPPYRVETAYPFGLITKYLRVPCEGETVVYPALLPIDSYVLSDPRLHGERLSGQKGESANPYGIRDFVHGDPARIIHWKSTAKSGSWKVKEFEREKRLRVVIDLRLAPGTTNNDKTREAAISTAAAFIVDLPPRGVEIALRVNGIEIDPAGRGYVDAYLTALALASPPADPDLAPPPAEDSGITLIVSDLSDRLLPKGNWRVISRERLAA